MGGVALNMTYQEYLNSARKHNFSCEEILRALKSVDLSNGVGKSKQKHLLLNLYYLSGYIIECSVKYAIYHLISYDRKKCVRQLDQDGISFQNNIRFHKFEMYVNHLKVRQPGIILIDDHTEIDKEVIFLYRLWDAEVRYWFNDIEQNIKKKLSEKNIEKLFELATKILTHVERI